MSWFQPLRRKRYYYSEGEQLFEKSLDVYFPPARHHQQQQRQKTQQQPIVLLVVGSAWMGHRWPIYSMCSWWNAAGPKTVARATGQICVCIRHRGTFFAPPSQVFGDDFWASPATPTVALILALLVADAAIKQASSTFVLGLVLIWGVILRWSLRAWAALSVGNATLPDMCRDVAQAIQWIQAHPETLQEEYQAEQEEATTLAQVLKMKVSSHFSSFSTQASFEEDDEDDPILQPTQQPARENYSNNASSSSSALPPLVFGGYSSGGHVAAILLSEWDKYYQQAASANSGNFAAYINVPPPEKLFSGILLISGVLGLRPHMAVIATTAGATRTTITSKTGSRTRSLKKQNSVKAKSLMSSSSMVRVDGPMWLINIVMRMIWGDEDDNDDDEQKENHHSDHDHKVNDTIGEPKIPSPVERIHQMPNIPHLLIGNGLQELFGLNFLNVFFCSDEYSQMLRGAGISATYCQLQSDHWNILASTALKETLESQLPRLVATAARNKS